MKKILSLLLLMAMCFAMVACGGEKECIHLDVDKNAICDKCGGEVLCTSCVDLLPKDAKCDVCGKDVPCAVCTDVNRDGKCDICHGDVPCDGLHVDRNKDKKCDICDEIIPCAVCTDSNFDQKCDVCGKEVELISGTEEIRNILEMYNAVAPSRVETNSVQTFGEITFAPIKATLLTGIVDGATVAVYEYTETKLRTITEGAGTEIVSPFVSETHKMEYSQKLGLRVDGGKWNIAGEDFTPEVGSNAFNFTVATVSEIVENKDDKTYTFVVLQKNTEDVFGEKIDGDVTVVITHSGADITGIEISYTVESGNKNFPDISVKISCSYSYETQEITLN